MYVNADFLYNNILFLLKTEESLKKILYFTLTFD